MAIFRLQVTALSRAAGRRATAAAAYRAGESLRDERTGERVSYARRNDVLHKEILLPQTAAGASWALDRERLWNTAEAAEPRRNSRVAREFQVALPAELDGQRRIALAQTFARELTERYGVAIDLAVHAPRPEGDARNFHAHLLATTRAVHATGLGAKTGLDSYDREDPRTSIEGRRAEYRYLRERWATLTNGALAEAGLEARVDHRSYAERGLPVEPQPHLSMVMVQMERRQSLSHGAERLREAWRARVAEAAAAPLSRGPVNSPERAPGQSGADAIRRQAREAWLALRAAAGATDGGDVTATRAAGLPRAAAAAGSERSGRIRSAGTDDDFTR